MTTAAGGSDAHLDAFINGFRFALLAMQGRLTEGPLAPEERARVQSFLDDYWRIVHAYEERQPEVRPPGSPLPIEGRFRGEVVSTASN